MRTIFILCLMVAAVLLASCGTTATTIVSRQRLDKDAAGKLAYERVAVTSSVRQFTQGDLDQLRDAVLARVPQPVDGGVPVTLQLAVTDYSAPGSKLVVRVRVMDAAGRSYAQFDVYQTANTMLGAVDQRSSDINAVADAVARSLMAISAAPPATVDARNFGS
jgi:hypothetical protein